MAREGFPEEVLAKKGPLVLREEQMENPSNSTGLEHPGAGGGKGCCVGSSMGESVGELELYLAEQMVEAFCRI